MITRHTTRPPTAVSHSTRGRSHAGFVGLAAAALMVSACASHKTVANAPAAASDTPSTSESPSASANPSHGPYVFAYPAMWPFRSQEEATAWHSDMSHQPWHLDAAASALSFAKDYLGYTDINRVTSSKVAGSDARIGVGYVTTGTNTATSAVVHLVRFGAEADAPWEVVGTDDTTLTLDLPGYGTAVGSPTPVGGLVTGVDENLKITVHQVSSSNPIGTFCCIATGGEKTPWHATLSYGGVTDPVITIAVATGGHIKSVERFAVTAARPH